MGAGSDGGLAPQEVGSLHPGLLNDRNIEAWIHRCGRGCHQGKMTAVSRASVRKWASSPSWWNLNVGTSPMHSNSVTYLG